MANIMVSFFDQFPEFNGVQVEIRGKDGYFDATAMSKAMGGKRFNNWTRTDFAKRLLKALSEQSGIPTHYSKLSGDSQTPLIDHVQGSQKGVWLHPYVALSYAMSVPEFQALVNIWIINLARLGTVNPNVLQWTRAELERGIEYNRDDIEDLYGE